MTGDNIYTDGGYLKKNPSWGSEDSEWKAIEINKLIARNQLAARTVVEIGCGFGRILWHLSRLNKAISRLTGFDISPQAIQKAQELESDKLKFFQGDFAIGPAGYFDLVLVIDVIEHLENYFEFLRNIRDAGDKFIFHIPIDLSCRTLFKPHITLQQRRDVGHLHYFSHDHIEWILKDTGYVIIDWTLSYPEVDRNKPANFKSWLKKILRKISFTISKKWSVTLWGGYSIMILAAKDDE